jgi:hypothetical protein
MTTKINYLYEIEIKYKNVIFPIPILENCDILKNIYVFFPKETSPEKYEFHLLFGFDQISTIKLCENTYVEEKNDYIVHKLFFFDDSCIDILLCCFNDIFMGIVVDDDNSIVKIAMEFECCKILPDEISKKLRTNQTIREEHVN